MFMYLSCRFLITWLIMLAALGLGSECEAHVRSESFSQWRQFDQSLTITFTIRAREVSRIASAGRLEDLPVVLSAYLSDKLLPQTATGYCELSGPLKPIAAKPGFVQIEGSWYCPGVVSEIRVNAFLDIAPEHVHFATLHVNDKIFQTILTQGQPRWVVAVNGNNASITSFFKTGVRHITVGYDHIAFLIALVLVCSGSREIILAVTGFTLGHSITLGLAMLGLMRSPGSLAEVIIGATILLTALELGIGRSMSIVKVASLVCILFVGLMVFLLVKSDSALPLIGVFIFSICYLLMIGDLRRWASLRMLTTGLFGFLHGLAVAGSLNQQSVATTDILAYALIGFNVGVELAQLVVVGLIMLLGYVLIKRLPTATVRLGREWVAACLCGFGVFLIVHRTIS